MKAVNSEVTIWGQDLKLKLTTQLCFSTPDVVSKTLFYGNKVILRGSWAFPDSSGGKEASCNARDPGSIPGLGRSAGEGIGYPTPVFLGFRVAQLVRNLPAMQETCVRCLGWDPPEKGKAIHSNILAWRIPWTMWGHKELDMTKQLSLSQEAADKTYFKRQSKCLFSCYNLYLVCSLILLTEDKKMKGFKF